jgi:uncharacterized protein YbjT (DUF2867 family)
MYVLLGANGNITSKAARILLSQGNDIRVVGRSAARLEPLRQAGAQLAIGDIADVEFLSGALRGAQAVYTMIPPQYGAPEPLVDYARAGEAIAKAITAVGVKRVVNLSSTGAHLAAGTGPIVALRAQEARLNAIAGVHTLHLRPGYFFENHLNAIGLIKAYGVYSDTLDPNAAIPSIATSDVAQVVARALREPGNGAEKWVLHLRGPKPYTPTEAAAILGDAIGKPDLHYAQGKFVLHLNVRKRALN